jgi:hypothetical protein
VVPVVSGPGSQNAAAKKGPITIPAGAPIPTGLMGGVVPPDESIFDMNLEDLADKPWRKPGLY